MRTQKLYRKKISFLKHVGANIMYELDALKNLPKHYGVMLCGHGSRSKDAVQQFENIANILAKKLAPMPFEYGFFRICNPHYS